MPRVAFGLTQKQEAFCTAAIKLGNASAAYREAYKPANSKPKTITEKASRLLKQDKVQARIGQLRETVVEAAQFTLASHLAKLAEIRDLAVKEREYSPAVAAEVNRGKVGGFYVERK